MVDVEEIDAEIDLDLAAQADQLVHPDHQDHQDLLGLLVQSLLPLNLLCLSHPHLNHLCLSLLCLSLLHLNHLCLSLLLLHLKVLKDLQT